MWVLSQNKRHPIPRRINLLSQPTVRQKVDLNATFQTMSDKSDILKMKLHGGPHDGEEIEIHRDHLKLKPWIGASFEEGGEVSDYKFVDGKFIWIEDPNDPQYKSSWMVFDDDGNLLSEVETEEEMHQKLDDFNDSSERWKFGRKD